MDIFLQKKVLVRIVIVLVVLNLVSIGVFVWNDYKFQAEPKLFPHQNDFRDMTSILQKELEFSDEQMERIKALRNEYFEKENHLATIIRAEKDSMNVEMFNKTTNADLINHLSRAIANNGYTMEMMRYEQAKRLKAICTAPQLEKFEKLVLEIRDYFRPDNQPKKK